MLVSVSTCAFNCLPVYWLVSLLVCWFVSLPASSPTCLLNCLHPCLLFFYLPCLACLLVYSLTCLFANLSASLLAHLSLLCCPNRLFVDFPACLPTCLFVCVDYLFLDLCFTARLFVNLRLVYFFLSLPTARLSTHHVCLTLICLSCLIVHSLAYLLPNLLCSSARVVGVDSE